MLFPVTSSKLQITGSLRVMVVMVPLCARYIHTYENKKHADSGAPLAEGGSCCWVLRQNTHLGCGVSVHDIKASDPPPLSSKRFCNPESAFDCAGARGRGRGAKAKRARIRQR